MLFELPFGPLETTVPNGSVDRSGSMYQLVRSNWRTEVGHARLRFQFSHLLDIFYCEFFISYSEFFKSIDALYWYQ